MDKTLEYADYASIRLVEIFETDQDQNDWFRQMVIELLNQEGCEHVYDTGEERFTFTSVQGGPIVCECEHGTPIPIINNMFHELMHLILLDDVDITAPDTIEGVELTIGQKFGKSVMEMVAEPLDLVNTQYHIDLLAEIIDNEVSDMELSLDNHYRLVLHTLDGRFIAPTHKPHPYGQKLVEKLNEMAEQAVSEQPINNELESDVLASMHIETGFMGFINIFCAYLLDEFGERTTDPARHYMCWMLENRIQDGRTLHLIDGVDVVFDEAPFSIDSLDKETDILLEHKLNQFWHAWMH